MTRRLNRQIILNVNNSYHIRITDVDNCIRKENVIAKQYSGPNIPLQGYSRKSKIPYKKCKGRACDEKKTKIKTETHPCYTIYFFL